MYITTWVISVFLFAGLVYGEIWIHFGGSSYYFSEEEKTFHRAKIRCIDLGAHLVEINDGTEMESLKGVAKYSQHTGFWIGAREHLFNKWVWTTSRHPMTFTYWAHGEPDNLHYLGDYEDCVIMDKYKHYHWNDMNCVLMFHFICEKKRHHITNIKSTQSMHTTTPSTTSSPFAGPLVPLVG